MKQARTTLLGQIVDPAARSQSPFRREAQRALADLKQQYIRVYLDLHTRGRLGVNDDARKRRLLNDERLKKVSALATIDLMPRRQRPAHQPRRPDHPRAGDALGLRPAYARECPHRIANAPRRPRSWFRRRRPHPALRPCESGHRNGGSSPGTPLRTITRDHRRDDDALRGLPMRPSEGQGRPRQGEDPAGVAPHKHVHGTYVPMRTPELLKEAVVDNIFPFRG